MTVDELIAVLDAVGERAELVAFLAPLRVPDHVTNSDRARLTSAVIRAASRCWSRPE
jgi:hypothetical protein